MLPSSKGLDVICNVIWNTDVSPFQFSGNESGSVAALVQIVQSPGNESGDFVGQGWQLAALCLRLHADADRKLQEQGAVSLFDFDAFGTTVSGIKPFPPKGEWNVQPLYSRYTRVPGRPCNRGLSVTRFPVAPTFGG